jgi:hypothetical protein
MTRTVYVVPHCHWDREWYQPHELFRWRLVQMIDELLDHMEQHPEYPCFNLDGQSIVIADYLELRPENEGRLRTLIECGRIVIGPWWVQPDEFLPSCESHIRSFQKGIRFAEALGGSLKIGHCADQFGHIAQMPQLMAQLGLTSACLWRGVPDSVPGWSFWWEAPDGTRLPVLYLRDSYSSGWRLPEDPDDLIERTRRQEIARRDDEPALLMNGTDHSRMEKHVPAALAAAAGRGYDYRMATLADYERAQKAAGNDEHVHAGELRSPDRSNVLVGVLSARMNIKQRDFQVGGALERYAEPLELLASLHGGPDGLPALRQAWRLMLENSPHDSICGCSVDQTHREMFPRYDRAEQLAREVARESMAHIVTRLATPESGALAVFRPVPHAAAVLEVDVPADWEERGMLRLPDGTTVPYAVEHVQRGEVLYRQDVSPRGALRHLDFIREGRFDAHYVEAMRWELQDRHLRLQTVVGDALNAVDDATVRREVREIATNGLADTAEVSVLRSGRRRLRAVLPPTDTIGVQVLTIGPREVPTVLGPTAREGPHAADLSGTATPEILSPTAREGPLPGAADISVSRDSISNAYYEVSFRKGKLRIRDWQNGIDLKNASAFISEGDRGDEYNADILPDAQFGTAKAGFFPGFITTDSVSATLRFVATIPAAYELKPSRRRRGRLETHISAWVEVTLWAAVPRLDFRVEVINYAADHRLRALFPLPFGVEHAITENQFHVAERSLEVPPWNGESAELPPTTFPQKTFSTFESGGAGVAVFNKGLPEGEVVRDRKGRQAYALTLLRCVGWLSRPDLVTRRGGAGPTIATPDAQMRGEHTFEYALTTYRGSWREAGMQAMAHSYAYPPLAFVAGGHTGSHGAELPLARLSSPALVPSALHRSDADCAPIVRVYNAAGEPLRAAMDVPAAGEHAARVDLLERPVEHAARGDPGWELDLRPWEIASLRFGDRAP